MGDPAHRARRRPRHPRAHAAEAPAGARRLRRGRLRRAPGVGHGIRRHAGAGLRRAAGRRSRPTARTPAWSPPTAPTRSRRTRTSRSRGSACSTAGSSTPSPTCAAAARWGGAGTTTASCSRRPTPSPTPWPPSTTWSRPGGSPPTVSGSKVVLPEGCSSVRCSTWPPSGSGSRMRRCRSSTRSRRCCSPTCRSPWGSGRSGATRSPTPRCTPRCAPTRRTRTSARSTTRPCWRPRACTTPGSTSPSRPSGSSRLRETVTSDPQDRPVLLRTELAAGHGGRSGRYAAWEQIAWEWAFVLDQLGATERL